MIKKRLRHGRPHRSLLKATGVTDADMGKPFIAIANSYTDIIPGHVHSERRSVRLCVRQCAKQAAFHSCSTPSAWTTASPWATPA